MTEKRFKLAFENFDGWGILDTTGEYSDDEDYIDWLSGQKAVDVLNHFAEENEQLKLNNKRYMLMVNANSDLNDEIYEQLKKTEKKVKELYEENQALKSSNMEYEDALGRLEEKNEQLKQSIDTRISVEDNYRKHLEIYSDQYFKLKEYINELLTKKYNHYEEMKKTIRNKEAQKIYTNILKVIKELQEDVDTEWGE